MINILMIKRIHEYGSERQKNVLVIEKCLPISRLGAISWQILTESTWRTENNIYMRMSPLISPPQLSQYSSEVKNAANIDVLYNHLNISQDTSIKYESLGKG